MSGLGDALWEHKPKRLSLCVSWVTRQGTETWNSHGRVCCCFLFWEKEIVKYIYLDGYWYRYIENFLIIWQFSHLNLPLLCRMKVYLILHLSLASNTEHAQWAHPLPAMLTRTIFQGITRELGRKSATDCVSIMRTQRKEGRKVGCWLSQLLIAVAIQRHAQHLFYVRMWAVPTCTHKT